MNPIIIVQKVELTDKVLDYFGNEIKGNPNWLGIPCTEQDHKELDKVKIKSKFFYGPVGLVHIGNKKTKKAVCAATMRFDSEKEKRNWKKRHKPLIYTEGELSCKSLPTKKYYVRYFEYDTKRISLRPVKYHCQNILNKILPDSGKSKTLINLYQSVLNWMVK